MKGAATEDTLATLHNQLAEAFLDRIRSGGASPADLNAARQFLKDNSITCDGPRNHRMNALADSLDDITLEDMQQ